MKMIFAADGSRYTKKALAFLVTHESLADHEPHVVAGDDPMRVHQRLAEAMDTALAQLQQIQRTRASWTR